VSNPVEGADKLSPELEAIANGEYAELKRVTSALLRRMTSRMPAEDPGGFARAVQGGR
jgi:hypothetical protein